MASDFNPYAAPEAAPTIGESAGLSLTATVCLFVIRAMYVCCIAAAIGFFLITVDMLLSSHYPTRLVIPAVLYAAFLTLAFTIFAVVIESVVASMIRQ